MMPLSDAIVKAFLGVPKPSDIRALAPHPCVDCDELAASFLPFDFCDLPDDILVDHHDCLPLLSPAALNHYLPSYLLYALRFPASMVMESTVYHLAPSAKSFARFPGYFEERFGTFSFQQRQIIAEFFKYLSDHQLFQSDEGELERGMNLWPSKPI